MLTKDLIQCRLQGNRLLPSFVRTNDQELLDLAAGLLPIFRTGLQTTLEELEQLSEPLITGFPRLKVARGLMKVLRDRCEFTASSEMDFQTERRKIFQASAALLKSEQPLVSEEEYRNILRQRIPDSPLLGSSLYPDLPENDRLTKFSDLNPVQLLQRYNVALVQSLLLTADSLEIKLATTSAPKLRRLFQYLRFFRLLADIKMEKGTLQNDKLDAASAGIVLKISGPSSVLENAKKYGVQLATFFPAVCSLEHWDMRATVNWKDKPRHLLLDQNSQLVCPYHNFAAIVPEEIELFRRYFSENVHDWRLAEESSILRLQGNEICIPDFTFINNKNGQKVQLELFHNWHSTVLLARLHWLKKHPQAKLILGIDRKLSMKPEIAQELSEDETRIFLFRDYPTVEKTLKALASCINLG